MVEYFPWNFFIFVALFGWCGNLRARRATTPSVDSSFAQWSFVFSSLNFRIFKLSFRLKHLSKEWEHTTVQLFSGFEEFWNFFAKVYRSPKLFSLVRTLLRCNWRLPWVFQIWTKWGSVVFFLFLSANQLFCLFISSATFLTWPQNYFHSCGFAREPWNVVSPKLMLCAAFGGVVSGSSFL